MLSPVTQPITISRDDQDAFFHPHFHPKREGNYKILIQEAIKVTESLSQCEPRVVLGC